MNTEKRLLILEKWFALYDDFMADSQVACKKGCATCCTCNVTCTTLEGLAIHNHLKTRQATANPLALVSNGPKNRFQPAITTNRMAELCTTDQELPAENNDPTAGPCLWLDDTSCSMYPARPFGCRALCSISNCGETGEAVMPPLVLSVNNLMLQYIEALDRPGATGNITDILSYLSEKSNLDAYNLEQERELPPSLLPNQRFKTLMIPPEHRLQLQPLIRAMGQVIGQVS